MLRIKYLRQVVTAVADSSVAAVAALVLDDPLVWKKVLNAKEPVVLRAITAENKHSLQVLGTWPMGEAHRSS